MVKWLDILTKEAGQREKKDMKFWGAVVEIVQLCRLGVQKEAKERIMAKELDHKIGGWVDWGLGRKRRCTCEVARDKAVQPDGRSSAEYSSKYVLDQPSSGRRPSRPDWLPASELSRGVHESRLSSAEVAKQSTVWGLGDLATLHENMMRPASVMTFASTAWGLGNHPNMNRDSRRPASITSGKESTVWGLGDAQREDEDDRHTIGRRKSDTSATNSCIAMGEVEVLEGYNIDGVHDDDEDYESVLLYGKEDWPLPHGTLTLDRGKAREMDGYRDLQKIGAIGIKGMG